MYARVTPIRFPPSMRTEVVGVAQGLVAVLRGHQGYKNATCLRMPKPGRD
jgi:hypothetical protein